MKLYCNKHGVYSDFVSIFHHKYEVSIMVYRGTDTSIVVHEFITSNLKIRRKKERYKERKEKKKSFEYVSINSLLQTAYTSNVLVEAETKVDVLIF